MKQEIKNAIMRGELILLFGAGASRGSTGAAGQSLYDGEGLSKHLSDIAGFDYSGEGLQSTYGAAVQELGVDRVNRELSSLFRNCRPSKEYTGISKYTWARIYTLNIDDALEAALRVNSSQRVTTRYRNDVVANQDQMYQELDIIKLNGSADREGDGFIFSPQEYGRSSADIPNWYRELSNDFFRFKFLFIGTKLIEPLFYHAIERHRANHGGEEPTSYVMTPSATEIQKKNLRRLKLEHVAASFEEFVAWLTNEIPIPPAPLELAQSRRPELRAVIDGVVGKTREHVLNLLRSVTVVSQDTLRVVRTNESGAGQIRDFYRGFKPSWQDILDEVPAPLAATNRFLNHVLSSLDKELPLTVCFGPAGSGKTTLLMRTALALSSKINLPIYFLNNIPKKTINMIRELEKINPDGYVLFTDNLDLLAKDLQESITDKVLKIGKIVASERQNVWLHRTESSLSEYVEKPFQLGRIDESDASKILEKVQKFGPWTRLNKMSEKQRVNELIHRARRQLLIGLLETTNGLGFEEIIKRDYTNLASEEEKIFLVIIALATINRVYMPESLAVRALTISAPTANVAPLYNALSGIVIKTANGLAARHPVYVQYLLEKLTENKYIVQAITAVLTALSVYGSPATRYIDKSEAKILKSILNHHFLRRILRDEQDEIFSIYRSFETVFHNDGLFWLQYGLALRDFDDQAGALEKLRTAVDAYSSDHTLHALAQQYLILANGSQSWSEAQVLLEEAIDRLRHLRQVNPDEDTYPIVTLAEGHTQVVRKFAGEDEARKIAARYANEMSDFANGLPKESRLSKAHQEFDEIRGNRCLYKSAGR